MKFGSPKKALSAALAILFLAANAILILVIRSRGPSRETAVTAVTFCSNDQLLACGSGDGRIKLIEVASGATRSNFKAHQDAVTDISSTYNQKHFATVSSDGVLKVWNSGDGQKVGEQKYSLTGLTSVACSPDNIRIACGTREGTIYVTSLNAGKLVPTLTLKGDAGPINDIAFNRDGRLLAGASADGTLRIWDAHTGKFLRDAEGLDVPLDAIAFNPNRSIIIGASGDRIRFWDPETGQSTGYSAGAAGKPIRSIAYHPNATWLAVATSGGGIVNLDMATGMSLFSGKGGTGSTKVSFSSDGSRLAVASGDSISVGDITPDGKILALGKGRRIFSER